MAEFYNLVLLPLIVVGFTAAALAQIGALLAENLPAIIARKERS